VQLIKDSGIAGTEDSIEISKGIGLEKHYGYKSYNDYAGLNNIPEYGSLLRILQQRQPGKTEKTKPG